MAIRVVCNACQKVHQVPDEIAGRRARCDCGATFRVPRLTPSRKTPLGQRRRLLTEATLNEVLEELHRRGYHGVFAQLDVHDFGVDNLADFVDAGEPLTRGVECHLTEALDEDRRANLLKALADGVERLADPAAADQADSYYEPFSIKGDPLGMSLTEFKQKHRRVIPGQAQPAPFSSDRAGGFAIGELHTEPWHNAAGIVHARLDYPSEDQSPPIAGVATDLVLYQFIDGSLYQVFALFGPDEFPRM
ncbi:MAG: hypothetical protein AAF596_10880, partial [Planctomycetota bacterium]